MQHVKTVKLGEICERIISGGTPSTERADFWNGDIPWITSADIHDFFTATPKKTITAKAGANVLPAGNIIIVTRVGLGKLLVTDQDLAFSQDSQGLYLKPGMSNRYLAYALGGEVQKFKTIGRGATIKGVTREDLVNLEIPLPDLDTQRHIAAVLDRADALRQKDRQLLAYYEQLPQAVFLEMFGDPVRNEKGWEVSPAKSLIHDIVAGDSYGGDERPLQENELGVLKVSAVTSGYFRPDEYKAVPVSSIRKTIVKPKTGDLLFSRANTRELVAATCIVDRDYHNVFLPDKLWRIDLDKELANPYYVKMLLSHRRFRDSLTKTATGTSGSMLNVSMEKLKALKMLVPPTELQNEFAEIVKGIEQQQKLALAQLVTSEALFQSLLDGYFGKNA
jgi:type I restriction enzyme, S subunit